MSDDDDDTNNNNSRHHKCPFETSVQERRDRIRSTNVLRQTAAAAAAAGLPQTVPLWHEPTTNTNKDRKTNHPTTSWIVRPLFSKEIDTLQGPSCRCSCVVPTTTTTTTSMKEDGWWSGKKNGVTFAWSQLLLYITETDAAKDQSEALSTFVSDNTFSGVVVIGIAATAAGGSGHETGSIGLDDSRPTPPQPTKATATKAATWQLLLPPGIRSNGMISNCILAPNCKVYRNTLLTETHVSPYSIVMNCGTITFSQSPPNVVTGDDVGSSLTLSVGPERGGGRHLSLLPESTMVDVCRELLTQPTRGAAQRPKDTTTATHDTTQDASSSRTHPPASSSGTTYDCNRIGPYAILRDTPTIANVSLAPYACIQGATCVSHAVLLEHACIEHASTAWNVRLQWKASIATHSTVSHALLMEHAQAGPHSLVTNVVLGPDVHVSAGEVHASILGPNSHAHHQSLLIGVLWPLGRGNVGYGANVGSNHTGRLPDQEAVVGEGMFWGLNCTIKFPVNLSHSPYSIVAAGTTLLPQRVSMPFSLFVDHSNSNDANNHSRATTSSMVVPGWVLHNSPYTLARSEQKIATRRKAKRHMFYTGYTILRPDIVDMCVAAREALRKVGGGNNGGGNGGGESHSNGSSSSSSRKRDEAYVYESEQDTIAEIGRNVLTEYGRKLGIVAYTECIQRYALNGLLHFIEQVGETSKEHELMAALHRQSASRNIPLHHQQQQQQKQENVVSWTIFPWDDIASSVPLLDHQLSTLRTEFNVDLRSSSQVRVVELLQTLVTLEYKYVQRVRKSKSRDDDRGATIIPGYADSHVSADKDSVVTSVQLEANEVEMAVNRVLLKL